MASGHVRRSKKHWGGMEGNERSGITTGGAVPAVAVDEGPVV
jgi:hypothetical protein